jgi:uncharacterized protein
LAYASVVRFSKVKYLARNSNTTINIMMYWTKRLILPLIALFVLNTGTALAQDFTESHKEKAEQLLLLLNIEETLRSSTEAMMAAGGEEMEPFTRAMRAFFDKHMTWDNLRPRYIRVYASVFDEDELAQLIAFYQTEIGQKYAQATPELTQLSAQIGQEIMMENMAEFQEMIMGIGQ